MYEFICHCLASSVASNLAKYIIKLSCKEVICVLLDHVCTIVAFKYYNCSVNIYTRTCAPVLDIRTNKTHCDFAKDIMLKGQGQYAP